MNAPLRALRETAVIVLVMLMSFEITPRAVRDENVTVDLHHLF
jgi:hypothetical protein